MKIKFSFVTNSSTASFVVITNRKIYKKDVASVFRRKVFCIDNIMMKDKEKLVEYIQSGEYDFLNDVYGPREYHFLSEESYKEIMENKEIYKNHNVGFISLERSCVDGTFENFINRFFRTDSNLSFTLLEGRGE